MPTSRLTANADVGGIVMSSTITRTADGQIGHEPTLPQAASASITAHSAAPDTWTIDFTAAHGLSVNDNLDILVNGSVAYGMKVSNVVDTDTVEVVDGTTVPTDNTALPTSGLPVSCIAVKQTEIDCDFDTDLLSAIAALCTTQAHLTFAENTGVTLIKAVNLAVSEIWEWFSGGAEANPLGAGNLVGRVLASQFSTSSTGTLKLGILYDSTP